MAGLLKKLVFLKAQPGW